MSFVSVQPITDTDPIIHNSGFWPDIDCKAAREVMRGIDGTVTDARLKMALIDAAARVNTDLANYRRTNQENGIDHLSKVPADTMNGGDSIKVHHYLTAVYNYATALLYERFRSYDTTTEGHQRADGIELPLDQLRQAAKFAIREILDLPLCTIELI